MALDLVLACVHWLIPYTFMLSPKTDYCSTWEILVNSVIAKLFFSRESCYIRIWDIGKSLGKSSNDSG